MYFSALSIAMAIPAIMASPTPRANTTARTLVVASPGLISLYSFDSKAFTLLSNLSVPNTNPSWILSSGGSSIYAVDENAATVNQFIVNRNAGTLAQETEGTVTGSAGAVHLEFSAARDKVFSSAFGSGTVDIYNVDAETQYLTKTSTIVMGAAKQSTPHQTLVDPTGAFTVTPDLAANKLWVSPVSVANIAQSTEFAAPTGCGPRHGIWLTSTANNPVYAVLCELGNQIITYDTVYTNSSLTLKQSSTISSLDPAAGKAAGQAAGELLVSGDGKTVYASNRRTDSQEGHVAAFSWDGKGLTFVKSVDAGGFTPRMMSLSTAAANKNSDFLYVGNQSGGKGLVAYAMGTDGSISAELASVDMAVWGTGTNGPAFVLEI